MQAAAVTDAMIAAAICRLCARTRGSICPSEAARACADDWRALMPRVREVAGTLAAAGVIEVLQSGEVVTPSAVVGPIRLRRRAASDDAPDTPASS